MNHYSPQWCTRTISDTAIWAPGISIRWRDSDSALFFSATTTADPNNPTASESTPNFTTAGSSSASDTPIRSKRGGGFNGQTIGIAVGCTAAAILIIGAGLWYLFKNKKRHHNTPENPAEHYAPGGPAELEGYAGKTGNRSAEATRVPGSQELEATTISGRHELEVPLSNAIPPQELPAKRVAV